MWYFLYTIESSDVVQCVNAGGKASVKTEDLIVDEGGEGEVIEKIGEILPNTCVSVFSETLVVEAINLSDLTGFVVTTEDSNSLGVSYFKSD